MSEFTCKEAMKAIATFERLKEYLDRYGKYILANAIDKSGVSLRRFSEYSNYSPTYICKVRKGDIKMSIALFNELCMKGYVK